MWTIEQYQQLLDRVARIDWDYHKSDSPAARRRGLDIIETVERDVASDEIACHILEQWKAHVYGGTLQPTIAQVKNLLAQVA